MIARGCGVRDIVAIEGISSQKALTTLVNSDYKIKPKKQYYQFLEIEEFWTFVGNKKNKQWLIYAYDREIGEIVAYVWGKRNLVTAKKLREKLTRLQIKCGVIAIDNGDSFITAFENEEVRLIGKAIIVGIEGNNCRI